MASPNEKRLAKEAELDKLSAFGVSRERDNVVSKLKRALGRDDSYGTSASAGAKAAGDARGKEEWDQGKSVGEIMASPKRRQAMREAAAEERREARGYAAGGMVRGDGIARKGKTRGKVC